MTDAASIYLTGLTLGAIMGFVLAVVFVGSWVQRNHEKLTKDQTAQEAENEAWDQAIK